MQVIHEEAVHEEVIHDSAVHGEVIHEKAIHSSAVHDQDGMQQEVQPLKRSTRMNKPYQWLNIKVYFHSNAIAYPIQATYSLASYPQANVVFISNLDQEY
ncbi:hypothetical protein F2Q69_00007925 [Brassica cretica]|uniref:Uncharacterized protein n=1 Tax=Brassica cretica TaxID=69181 RepID=A0A8S9P7D7_BRACR|nr:hypothetical protein F2Q69_00007925 [Brassica cretica]